VDLLKRIAADIEANGMISPTLQQEIDTTN
jgi:hypothetical protein